ncbi:hypothetical protein [Komagataeibacter saccharivorans]|uniref:hypothetical protein n=1 Tax=Komagataeibacter saccharivorans TaxID=265959 RepID=UPI000C81DFD9|nr:hypothetical protein [Komagataeibacter saccharivorans]PMP98340.1 hypothetical protein S101450_00117 [Komagataeibacter saccharivorans]
MGLPGVFIVFTLITLLLELLLPRMNGLLQTLTGFYVVFALIAATIEIVRKPQPVRHTSDKA